MRIHRTPSVSRWGVPFGGFGAPALYVEFGQAPFGEPGPDLGVVVASVQGQGADLVKELPPGFGSVSGIGPRFLPRHKVPNTPALIHSSRRARRVVSETSKSMIASMSTHDEPATRRIRMPRKHTRSGTRGLWQPRGWVRSGPGAGSVRSQPRSRRPPQGPRARVMTAGASIGRWMVGALAIKIETPQRPVDGQPCHVPARP